MNHLEREREEKLKASQAYGEAVQTHGVSDEVAGRG